MTPAEEKILLQIIEQQIAQMNNTRIPVDYAPLVKLLQKESPDLWNDYCPRTYHNTPQYPSVKKMGAALCQGDIVAKNTPQVAAPITFHLLHNLRKHKVPTFYVYPELFQAACNTDPVDMTWNDMKYPFPAGVFVLPRNNGFLNEYGHEIEFIGWCYTEIGDLNFKNVTYVNDTLRASTWAICPTTLELYYLTTRGTEKLKIPPAEVDAMTKASMEIARKMERPALTLTADEKISVLNSKISSAVANLLLIMHTTPKVITHGVGTRTEPTKKHPKGLELWTPNFIGHNYQSERQTLPRSEVVTGEHVCPHWRRGHFHKQVYGPNNSLRKIRWQPPLWIDWTD